MSELRHRPGLYDSHATDGNAPAERTTETEVGVDAAGAAVAARTRAFRRGDYPVAVYGLGKMGLPLAVVFAAHTGAVTGVDVDPAVVEQVADGVSPVANEPRLDEFLVATVGAGLLDATTDGATAAAGARIHVVVVPTRLDDGGTDPDLSALRHALLDVGAGLDRGDLVLVESTVPPGTCADVVEPVLARVSGLGRDAFGVAYCPERTSSGRALADISGAYPKIVGGTDDAATRAATIVYDAMTHNDVVAVADATTAECVKLFEGVYRDVNIALANELAQFTDDLCVNVTDAIAAANTQPYCDIHRPGPGVGGHCIPFYPYFLLSRVERDAPLIRTARRVNQNMPAFTVRLLARRLEARGISLSQARVGVLGLAYRAGVAETTESPGLAVAAQLYRAGATVFGTDPDVETDDEPGAGSNDETANGSNDETGSDGALIPVSLADLPALDLDGVVVTTTHEAFTRIDWDAFDDLVVVDGRGLASLDATDHEVVAIGGNHVP